MLPNQAKLVIGFFDLSFRQRRRVVREVYLSTWRAMNGERYRSPLRGKEFVAWLLASELSRRPYFYIVGMPMAVLLYAVGFYGMLR